MSVTNADNQREFNNKIMLAALILCFKPSEELLCEAQILERGYAPIESYGKNCIDQLISEKAVEFSFVEPTFAASDEKGTLYIKRPRVQECDSYIYKLTQEILQLVEVSNDYTLYLKALSQDVLACEAIEYAGFYAKKNGLMLYNVSPFDERLRLLLISHSPNKVNAFLWMAIKTIRNAVKEEYQLIDFSKVVDIAYQRCVRYSRLGFRVDEYRRPSLLKVSVLAGYLTLLQSNQKLMNIKHDLSLLLPA